MAIFGRGCFDNSLRILARFFWAFHERQLSVCWQTRTAGVLTPGFLRGAGVHCPSDTLRATTLLETLLSMLMAA